IAPVLVMLVVLAYTYRRLPLTPLSYSLIFLSCILMIIGSHYSYAYVPIGDWARDMFGFSRNHYDRVGHFMQGFVPAMVLRELLLRSIPLQTINSLWLWVIIILSVTGFSAFYELAEWLAAEILNEEATSFLGMQG